MSKQIICAVLVLCALVPVAQAHEPIGLRLIREYHERNARAQAEVERVKQQFAAQQREWQSQAQRWQAALQKASSGR